MAATEPGTVKDLIADAAALGQVMSSRAITDWVTRGLLDKPERQNLGRGKGSTLALYPSRQRELFRLLLSKRGTDPGLAHLLTIPIGIWLYWGDDYVPTRQARRALTEWAKKYETTPANRARANVEALITQIASPHATPVAISRLRRVLIQASGGKIWSTDLMEAVASVVTPDGVGSLIGTPLSSVDPRAVVGSWIGQRKARRALIEGKVTEAVLVGARRESIASRTEWDLLQPLIIATAISPHQALAAPSTEVAQLIATAASDLMLPLATLLDEDRA